MERFAELPGYGIGAIVLLMLYTLQAELRFGARARALRAESSDRKSTWVLSAAAVVPVFGLVLALKANLPGHWGLIPQWFRSAVIPGMPAVAYAGVLLGAAGFALRLWAVLTLRERYTRTLLVSADQKVARNGPYRWVRHPGYLGSLLTLNGIALASGNAVTLVASVVATGAAYAYRIRVEDAMLVRELGEPYAEYREEVRALVPIPRARRRL